MSEVLANLMKKSDGVPSNMFSVLRASSLSDATTANTWANMTISGCANVPTDATTGIVVDLKNLHINNNSFVVDKPIPKAYISGGACYGRTSSGTVVYSGVRMLKNGTVISGTSVTGSSTTASPTFRRVQTSFDVGDIITFQVRRSSTTTSTVYIYINMVTDD